MTSIKDQKITCGKCQTAFFVTLYNSVNVSMAPHLKNELLNGELNVGDCPKCGAKYEVEAVVLYHDMEKTIMITVLPESFLRNKDEYTRYYMDMANNTISQLNANLKEKFNEYFVDVAFGIDDLEKKLDIIDVMKEPGVELEDVKEKMLRCRQILHRESKKNKDERIKWTIPAEEGNDYSFFQSIKSFLKKFLP